MSVTFADIKFYESSLPGSTGGVITATEVLKDFVSSIFADTLEAELEVGGVAYRKIFVKNVHPADDLIAAVVWMLLLPTSEEEFAVALGTAGDTDPTGLTFVAPVSPGVGLAMGDLISNTAVAIWLKKTTPAGTNTFKRSQTQICVTGQNP